MDTECDDGDPASVPCVVCERYVWEWWAAFEHDGTAYCPEHG